MLIHRRCCIQPSHANPHVSPETPLTAAVCGLLRASTRRAPGQRGAGGRRRVHQGVRGQGG
eukprot:8782508-Alexandrium_andersonii.AAC.1